MKLKGPYLLFLADAISPIYAKTAQGLLHWCPEKCLGQLRYDSCNVDLGIPDLTIGQAAESGARTLVIGVATVGGRIEDDWVATFDQALEAGLDIANGLHTRLATMPDLVAVAERAGRRLLDLRVPPADLPVGTGRKRTGRRILTVGTDCAVGKKWTALALAKAMGERGLDATFRATGQTGIMIVGEGLPIDAVVSDFISGAAETLSPDAEPGHWDVIEGQGSLFHPGYASVTLGLLHGSQPDAFVVCHEAGRDEIEEFPGYRLPSLEDCIDLTIANGRLTNPDIRCIGIAINTNNLEPDRRHEYLQGIAARTGLPCVDPVATGMTPIVDHLFREFIDSP